MSKKLLNKVNDSFKRMEERGWIKKTPAFLHDYEKKYRQFKPLEDNWEIIQQEALALLDFKEQITDLSQIGGGYTKGGVHQVKWKSYVLKSGVYLEKNCERCPETTKLLKKLPNISQVFFSILDPNQHIATHKGYYYGLLRYHLGLVIPYNNAENKCWIRINSDWEDNKQYDKSSIVRGEKYHWREGEGIMFNDNYLHEAKNETDKVRIVLFIDVARNFPWWIDWVNKLVLKIAYNTPQVKKIAKRSEVDFDVKPQEF